MNNLPASSNTNRLDPYFEAMVFFCSTTEQIMTSENSTIVYCNDVSGISGVGNYMVQYVIIIEKQQILPTMGIFTESPESLCWRNQQ